MSKKLAAVVVADPIESAARLIASICGMFSLRTLVATNGRELLRMAGETRPDLAIVALGLPEPGTVEILRALRGQNPRTRVIVTFRDLVVTDVGRLGKLGIEDLLPQPVEPAALARLVWSHFQISTRAHERYDIELEVTRPDGGHLGRTRNISEGGMFLSDMEDPIPSGQSLLFDLHLPDGEPLRVRGTILAAEGQVPNPMWVRVQFEPLRGSEYRRLTALLDQLAQR